MNKQTDKRNNSTRGAYRDFIELILEKQMCFHCIQITILISKAAKQHRLQKFKKNKKLI